MKKMHTLTWNLAGNRSDATVIGYGLIASLLAVVMALVVTSVGATLDSYPEAGTGASAPAA
jgi:Flp pilus assembly pilin Flp